MPACARWLLETVKLGFRPATLQRPEVSEWKCGTRTVPRVSLFKLARWKMDSDNHLGHQALDVAVTFIIVIAIWVIAHVYNSAYWYNRNLAMIANIERQFLRQSDLREIHYYWGKHRRSNSMIRHLKLQKWLALGIAALVLGIQFNTTMLPVVRNCFSGFQAQNFLPWIAAAVGGGVWYLQHRHSAKKFREFLENSNSPGKRVDTTGIKYGAGHPTDE